MWPKTIEEIASDFECDCEMVLKELGQLEVPIHQFLGKSVVYPADLHQAHQRVHAASLGPSGRDQHMDRALSWFRDNGCQIERASLEGIRARGIFQVTSNTGNGDPVFIKIQVCNTLQRGQRVHFNLNLDVLKHGQVKWFIMLAPVFSPGKTDFIGRLGLLKSQAKEAGYWDKPSFPFRVKETSSESYLEKFTQMMMEEIHSSYTLWQTAKQSLPPGE